MSKRHKKKKSAGPKFTLEPETKRGIVAVGLFLLSAILALALFGMAGPLGRFLDDGLASFFGGSRSILIVVFAIVGLQLLLPEKKLLDATSYVGLFLLFTSINGLWYALKAGPKVPMENAGGAYGLLTSQFFDFIVGPVAAYVVLVALLATSLLMIFRISLARLAQFIQAAFAGIFAARIKKDKPKILDGEEDARSEEEYEEEVMEEEEVEPVKPMPLPPEKVEEVVAEVMEEGSRPVNAQGPLVRPKRRRSIAIPIDLLDGTPSKPTSGDIDANIEIIERTLKNFGIPVDMGDVSVGPTVTQYSFKPADGVKLTRITALANDLSLALAAHPIRLEAPIPGKSLVGVEVPNKSVATVRFKDIVASKAFQSAASPLTCALGKDVSGKAYTLELDRMPHLLVAGATGSGKSVCLNTIILSLMYKTSPDDVKFILVDPKRVELPLYNNTPYLITPVITDVHKTINALKWAVQEMERRYEKLAAFGARDIKSYNERAEDGMPYLVGVIDELADLMAASAQEVEASIVRLAQMSRAVGIHLILATQRPSVNVITGLIKANIPGRIAFAVASAVDSRTILDGSGAEKLLGRGDMLLSTSDMGKPKRLQGAFVSEEEIRKVMTFLKNTCDAPEYDGAVVEKASNGSTIFSSDSGSDDSGDPLLEDAVRVVMQAGKASASLLQRRLKVGYSRAARLLDILEERGVIGPADGAKPRDVLMKGGSNPAPVLSEAPALEVSEEVIEDEIK
ncbi:MAG: DNA translocase FtsK 4TM domain-containing protein [bacterium]